MQNETLGIGGSSARLEGDESKREWMGQKEAVMEGGSERKKEQITFGVAQRKNRAR